MAASDKQLSIFDDRLKHFQLKLRFLASTKEAPEIYYFLLLECARRRSFSHSFAKVRLLLSL